MAPADDPTSHGPPAAPPLRMMALPAWSNRGDNPYQYLLHAAMQERGAVVEEFDVDTVAREVPDVVHLHWPEWVFSSASIRGTPRALRGLLRLAIARLRGSAVFWTAHNVLGGHDAQDRVRPITRLVLPSILNGWVALSEGTADEVMAEVPALRRVPRLILPHGHYRDVYEPVGRDEARGELGVGEHQTHLVCVGQIRRYKGTTDLLEAFRAFDAPNIRLTVAGRPVDADYAAQVAQLAEADPRVSLLARHLSDEELAVVVRSADLVVLPYRAVRNSGAALLALSLNVPVLGPDVPAFRDLRDEVGEAWVRAQPMPLGAETLGAAVTWASDGDQRRRHEAPLTKRDWGVLAEETLRFYRAAAPRLDRRSRRRRVLRWKDQTQ